MENDHPDHLEQVRLTVHTFSHEPDNTEPGSCIEIEGPMNSQTLASLSDPLLAAVGAARASVVIDLCGVSEIDSTGLMLLMRARKALPWAEMGLSLRVTARSQPARVLNLAGFQKIMPLIYSKEEVI